jgi:hypothetical protein
MQIDDAVVQAVLTALAPLGIEAAIAAAERIEADHDGAGAVASCNGTNEI